MDIESLRAGNTAIATTSLTLTDREVLGVANKAACEAGWFYPMDSRPRAYFLALSDLLEAKLGEEFTEAELKVATEKLLGN